jgi:outer membrane protein assembly factor BamD (BamD/ComL family)
MNWYRVDQNEGRFGIRHEQRELGAFSPREARRAKTALIILFALLFASVVSQRWQKWNALGSPRHAHSAVLLESFLGEWGEECVAHANYLEAIVIFEMLLETYPGSAMGDTALCKITLCWICLDKPQRAIETCERFLKLYPDSKHASRMWQSYFILRKDRPRDIRV